MPPCASREVWLETELLRLSNHVGKLADFNKALKEELYDEEDDEADFGPLLRSVSSKSIRSAGSLSGTSVRSSGSARSSGSDSVDPDQIHLESRDRRQSGDENEERKRPKKPAVRLSRRAESLDVDEDDLKRSTSEFSISREHSIGEMGLKTMSVVAGKVNTVILKGSALGLGKGLQAVIYLVALAGILFVLVATAQNWGGEHPHDVAARLSSSGAQASGASSSHRRYRQATVTPLMKNIAVTLTGCGLVAFTVNLLQQPLILGYLLGGVLVGPIGLGIVQSHHDVAELSSLGLIFLLFMIGLELDVKALLKMGRVVIVTGLLQFPICAGVQIAIFKALESVGFNFGSGPFASFYCGLTSGISSTMIVAKMLGEKGEMSTQAGRLTIGILIFQDIWAIVVLAIQPNLASPEILGILRTFFMIAVLIAIALAYAKFVMPALLYHAHQNVELMLVLSLSWCFFICCTAVLPFIGLSMELASLIAGVALASFPYSAEFNGKIKYIRDFFITLFFAALGMQIPVPSIEAIAMGALVAVTVLVFRWLGIWAMVRITGGSAELAGISTINLSEISEFALVICSLGIGHGHIGSETLTIIIWTFAMLAILASYMIGYNSLIYAKSASLINRCMGRAHSGLGDSNGDNGHAEHRDIVMLGFHKVAYMLVTEVKAKSPQLLPKMHLIDFNQSMMPRLRLLNITCTYGDISSPDVLEHAFHGDPKIVLCTIPDSMLRGVTNAELIKVCRQVWPKAHVVATADSPAQAKALYAVGADYVLRISKLCAERLHMLLNQHRQQIFHDGDLAQIFALFKSKDRELRSARQFLTPPSSKQ